MKRSLTYALALAAASLFSVANAQDVTLYGALSNFDAINNTPHICYGFEIEIHGSSSIGGTFTWNRYGAPQITPFNGGVYVRYMAKYDPATQKFVTSTPIAVKPTATNGHQCVLGTIGYDNSGCEHFGVWTYTNPTQTIYRWLIADPNNPGQLVAYGQQVAIPAPVWTVQPPPAPGEPAVVIADVAPVVPPPPAKIYGEAQWMKVYKTENQRQVGLDELLVDNDIVPKNEAQVEVSWDLMQQSLNDGPGGRQRRNRGSLGNGSKAVVRRYEFYKFSGTYDPVTNQAICADGLCNAPAADEVGDFIGAQNAAANLNVPPAYAVGVTVSGDGQVSSADRLIACPSICNTSVAPGTSMSFTAKGAKGIFTGWTGACKGTALTCTATINSAASVGAVFKTPYKLIVKTNGTGRVTSNPSGSTFLEGTTVTVTAIPGAGSTWKGWTGACTTMDLSCTVTINGDTTVQANFR